MPFFFQYCWTRSNTYLLRHGSWATSLLLSVVMNTSVFFWYTWKVVCTWYTERQTGKQRGVAWCHVHMYTWITCTYFLNLVVCFFSRFQKIMTYLMDFPTQVSQVLLKKRQSTLLNFPESQIQLNTGRGSGEHETIERKTKPDCWKELPVIIFKVCVPAWNYSKGKPNLTAGKNSQLSSLKYVFLHEIIQKENQTWWLERTPSYHL